MEPTSQSIESIYDIIYSDTKKIATYLAQIDPNGVMTGIKATSRSSTTITANGKASAVVISGEMSGSNVAGEDAEKAYDPSWVLPITLLNRLDELGFVHRGFRGSSIGSLILVKGFVRIIDVAMIKEMWPLIGRLVSAQNQADAGTAAASMAGLNRADRRKMSRTSGPPPVSAAEVQNDQIATILKNMPHGIEMHIVNTEGMGWATLKSQALVTSSEDIALKHGTALYGEWYMLGVLDTYPGSMDPDLWRYFPQSEIGKAMSELTLAARALMGRPDDYHGVTPLIIFREIKPTGSPRDLTQGEAEG